MLEKAVLEIEKRREVLRGENSLIEVVDFGAGAPYDKRSKEQMEAGVFVKIPLSNLAKIGVKKKKAECIYKIFSDLFPKTILELGTCCGFSSSYMSFFAPDSKIYTIEGSPNIATIARDNHQFFGLKNVFVFEGRFEVVLPKLLNEISPIDFAFIDGHHDKEATLRYFRQILPFMSKGGVMLFDDITWSDGMKEAWREIVDSKQYMKFEELGEENWKMGVLWL